MSFLNGARWINGSSTGVLNWSPTTSRTVTVPDDTITLLGEDRPIGSLNSGVSLRGYEPIVTVTATKTLALSDSGTVQNCTNAAYTVITVPLNSAVPFPIGTRIIIRKTTTLQIDVGFSVGVSLLSETGITANADGLAVVGFLILRKTAVDTWIVQNPVPPSINLRGTPTTITQLGSSNSQNIATTAHVKLALISTPALTSAVLSGTSSVPVGSTLTVPTATLGDISLNVASTAFVSTAITNNNRPALEATRPTAQSIAVNGFTTLIFNSVQLDTNTAYNSTTGVFTVPTGQGGMYEYSVYSGFSLGGNNVQFIPVRNGVRQEHLRIPGMLLNTDAIFYLGVTFKIRLAPGDTLSFECYYNSISTAATTTSTVQFPSLSLYRAYS